MPQWLRRKVAPHARDQGGFQPTLEARPQQGDRPAPDGSASHLLSQDFLYQLEHLSLLVRQPASAGLGGEYRSRAQASSVDFADYRPYTPGDDIRRIDWNVYGRLGELYVKLTEAREHLNTCILVDCSASMDWGEPNKLSYARALAAALGYIALGRNDLVSVICLAQHPRGLLDLRGRSRAAELLRFLQDAPAGGPLELAASLTGLPFEPRSARPRFGQALLISDLLMDDELQSVLQWFQVRRLDLAVLHVLSPQEIEPTPGGDLQLVDAETGERADIGLTLDAIGTYRGRLVDWLQGLESACWRRGVRYLRITSDDKLESVVLDTLRKGLVLV